MRVNSPITRGCCFISCVFFLRRELFFAIQKNNFNEAKKNLNEE
jgi:hypothetical protein